jgi:hypothetical protein
MVPGVRLRIRDLGEHGFKGLAVPFLGEGFQ